MAQSDSSDIDVAELRLIRATKLKLALVPRVCDPIKVNMDWNLNTNDDKISRAALRKFKVYRRSWLLSSQPCPQVGDEVTLLLQNVGFGIAAGQFSFEVSNEPEVTVVLGASTCRRILEVWTKDSQIPAIGLLVNERPEKGMLISHLPLGANAQF